MVAYDIENRDLLVAALVLAKAELSLKSAI
jgi:hypothetical protein